MLGAQQVAKAAPDGYTLLMAIDSTLTMNQYLYRNPPYDPFTDFVPVTLTAKTMQLLIVNAASDVKTVKELIAKARTQPGKLNYGAGTITTKLTGHLFNKAAGIDTVLVPYNGSAEVAQGVLTRSVDFSFDGPSASLSLIGLGVPFGATSPSQTEMSSRSGKPAASASVGMSAIDGGASRSSFASART